MKRLVVTVAAIVAAAPAFAGNIPLDPVAVPEITAMEGTAAIALVAAVVALIWERTKA